MKYGEVEETKHCNQGRSERKGAERKSSGTVKLGENGSVGVE